MIFATDVMVKLLARACTWYIDGTFKVVQKPFTQLVSIHAFIRKDKKLKQVPLVFVMMSGKSKEDYSMVLREILAIANAVEPIAVEQVVSDFEAAIWNLLPSVGVHSIGARPFGGTYRQVVCSRLYQSK